MRPYRNHLVACASMCVGLSAAAPARAASLQALDQSEWWGGVSDLPSYVNMYLYVPDQLATHPPIVAAPHHCQGDGPGTFSEMSSLVSLADQNGFIMIFPEATGQNCWDAGSERSLQHDGKGDTHAIVQMVRYTLSTYDGDAGRVYSVGTSSGGIMTEALLGVYPDVFMAGVSIMGVPCGCWAEDYNDVVGTPSNGTGQWSGPCSGGTVTKTGQEWGDLVRSYFPDYTGHRPRLQHWHGTADTVLSYANVEEDIKEWTNLLGLSEAPTGTDTPANGTTRKFWESSCGYTVYETFDLSGVGHAVPLNGNSVATYFGLDSAGDQDPETAACPDAVPGGAIGGAGGATATGGAGGVSGGAGGQDGGNAGVATGGSLTGGVSATGGGSDGGTGGSLATGGTVATGGSPATTGGASATGGAEVGATGGSFGSGGITTGSGTGGTSAIGTGSTQVGSGAASSGGAGVTGADAASPSADDGGCGCELAGHAGHSGSRTAAFLVAALGWVLRHRRRRAS